MANKMFYTVEEAAARLGMTADEVKGLGESGQLQEFRDQDRLMFKKDQVDLLGGDDGSDDSFEDITLAESGELDAISLSSSNTGTGIGLEDSTPSTGLSGDSASDTGISIFDPDESGADASSDTIVAGGGAAFADAGASGSGSGLSGLAMESDDTSLGGDLLADLGDSSAGDDLAGSGAGLSESSAGSLFEGDAADADFGGTAETTAAPMMMGEPYDGPWSGIAGGASLAAIVVLLAALAVVILSMTGSASADLLEGMGSNIVLIVAGGGIVAIAVFAVIGRVVLGRG